MKPDTPMKLKDAKIDFLIYDYTHGGGVERVTADLVELFDHKYHNVNRLISLRKSKSKASIDYLSGLNIEVLNVKKRSEIIPKLEASLSESSPDLLIFQGDNVGYSLAILEVTEKLGIIAIPQYHGSPYAYLNKYADAQYRNTLKIIWSKWVYFLKKIRLKRYLQNAVHGLVCVSEGSAMELKKIFSDPQLSQNIHVIRNPISIPEGLPLNKEKTVSFVSRLERKHKNAFLAVKAWKLICERFPEWTLKIYGEGSLKEQMMDFCKSNNIRNIEFCGFTKNLNLELAKSQISISTSNCEGFSMAIAEAIAQKNAVAITRSDGGITDMVSDQKTGLISPKNDPQALADNIALLIDNERYRVELSGNAVEHLNKIVSQNTLRLWERLIEKKLL